MDILQARFERDAGMQQALEHAEDVTPDWGELAYQFLTTFAMNATGPFISEDVSDAAKLDPTFPPPPTDRAWGPIYRRAARDGWIRQVGTGRSRRRHASICPMWAAV
jgi:hypothetical protein